MGAWTSQRQAKSNVLRAIDRVAEQLNNTRAVCRKYYVHPAVLDAYTAGTMLETLQNGTSPATKIQLDPEEAAVAGLLRHQLSLALAS
jgi:DNA topoisomerase I